MLEYKEIRHAHLYCGLGGGAKGFNQGKANIGNMTAKFRCLGGIDVDPACIRDFEKLTGVPGTTLDLFSRDQFCSFHGYEPPVDWKEATPNDIQKAFNYERPHIIFLSAPCKGFSGLMSESKSQSAKYQALNELTLRGIWLTLEAYKDDLPELFIFENVPRIATRGRWLLEQITSLLRSFGYAVAETTHDCGKLGGLAQSRKRFLLVARNIEKVPCFLYEPYKKPLLSVGKLLERMPLPNSPLAGPMHRMPNLQWKTWVRLAFIEAGSDWRSLNKLEIENGLIKKYGILQKNTEIAQPVINPIPQQDTSFRKYTVTPYNSSTGTVIAGSTTGQSCFAVADMRPEWLTARTQAQNASNIYKVVNWPDTNNTITGSLKPTNRALSVSDPRPQWDKNCPHSRRGFYGVTSWNETAKTVIGKAKIDNGNCAVADPRLPENNSQCVAIIRALDGTWHRPFTTLELATLQGLIDPEEKLELDGLSDSAWRERIGNAVPPPAAKAIADTMGQLLLLTWSGETFAMGATPIWVQPVVAALMAAPENYTYLD